MDDNKRCIHINFQMAADVTIQEILDTARQETIDLFGK